MWLFTATVAILFAVALLLSGMIVLEKDSEWLVRLTAALGIVSVAGSIALPVLGKLLSREKRGTAEGIREIEIVCPRCGRQETYPIGSIRCSECGLGLQVRVEAWEPAESETVLMS
jgi:ribosomal protein L37E